ncbi:hypothetical protein [Baaleninema sp.]|uniref:hypothetical protein n=1 Tax=Baaleninema sp. TaxID=3101197 RepID=UPI003D02D115
MKLKFFALLLALTLPLTACGGGDTASDSPDATTGEATEAPTEDTATDPPDTEDGATATDTTETADSEDSASETAEGDWYTYESENYSARFPGEPTENSQNVPVEGAGDIQQSLVIYEDSNAQRAYLIASNIMPEGVEFDIEASLENMQTTTQANLNATVESQESVESNGRPARAIVMSAEDGSRFQVLLIADTENAALYQVAVGAQDGNVDFPEAQQFFDSFELSQL